MKPQKTEAATAGRRRLVRLLELLDKESRAEFDSYADRALWHALTQWRDKLPELNDYFHKCFRQGDVTGDGHADMVIWNLLNHSSLFWRIFERVQDEPDFKSELVEPEETA